MKQEEILKQIEAVANVIYNAGKKGLGLDLATATLKESVKAWHSSTLQEVEEMVGGMKKKMVKKDQVGAGENLSNDTLMKLGHNKSLSDVLAKLSDMEKEI